MKKTLIILLCICLLSGLAACQPEPAENTADLNALLAQNYAKLTIELKTAQEPGNLVNTYALFEVPEGVQVDYSCQRFAQLSLSDTGKEPIETRKGTAVYKDGRQISQSGDPVSFRLPTSLKPNLDLSTANMDNLQQEEGLLKADIKDLGLLLGQNLEGSQGKITVSYTDNALTSIHITYTADAAEVSLSLTFVRE